VQDYGLGIWWDEGTDVIGSAIESGDPRPIERALRDYHDRVVAAGGVLYFQPSNQEQPERRRLAFATLAAIGDPIQVSDMWRGTPDPEVTWIIKTKGAHPAFHQLSMRRKLPTAADDKTLRVSEDSADGEERILVVLNFQPLEQTVTVDLSDLHCERLKDLKIGRIEPRPPFLKCQLPAYGYRFYLVEQGGSQRFGSQRSSTLAASPGRRGSWNQSRKSGVADTSRMPRRAVSGFPARLGTSLLRASRPVCRALPKTSMRGGRSLLARHPGRVGQGLKPPRRTRAEAVRPPQQAEAVPARQQAEVVRPRQRAEAVPPPWQAGTSPRPSRAFWSSSALPAPVRRFPR